MHRERKSTHVLMIGVTSEQWRIEKDLLKGGLQSADMAWSLTCGTVATIQEAVDYITACTDLEIVDVSFGARMIDMSGAHLIARAVAAHPYTPWVVLRKSSPLDLVFAAEGIHFEHNMLEDVIFRRWATEVAVPHYLH